MSQQDSQGKTRKSPPALAPIPRKRRKRTVVSGAADDCFTCARRGSQCDRRRPYCSQCLENGQDCSGYKTTLTWGVGVASRGKFRGLSVPVSGAQPTEAPSKSQTTTATATTTPVAHDLSPSDIPTLSAPQGPSLHPHLEQYCPMPETKAPAAHPYLPSPPVPSWATLHQTVSPEHLVYYDPSLSYLERTGLVTDVPPFSSTSDPLAGEACPPLVQSSSTVLTEWPYLHHPGEIPKNINQEIEEQKRRGARSASLMSNHHSPSFSQLLLARSVGRTPRLRYLISYFAEVIAPVIVAFDSPTNPFRTSLLRLAQESTSLQEAIATLSTSNLRQRRERGTISTGRTAPARMSSLAHRALTDGAVQESYSTSAPEGFAREEQYHRGMAVKALNMELADPHQRLSDSVLATLFILCLFHVCDTGVAQFRTQFAGVTKLLTIRTRNSPYLSDELKWFIRMFTWYDTMTATTNDRDIQLHSTFVKVAAVSDGEWGLENLAGCDASLFKLISHLGRLNILSQNREVTATAPSDMFLHTAAPPPPRSTVYDPYPPNSVLAAEISAPIPLPTPPRPGEQTRQQQPLSPQFWSEWFSIRQQLESWRLPRQRTPSGFPFEPGFAVSPSLDQAYISPPSSPLSHCEVAPQNVEDVFHISESFRHAAILYSERLAHPDLPSGHPRIQQIVQRSMAHILAVKSDVYLLWPLFITGSECVFEEHRFIIQERCKDISKDSGFFNNLSCLELLENIWAENPILGATGPGTGAEDLGAAGTMGPSPITTTTSAPYNSAAAQDCVPASPHSWPTPGESPASVSFPPSGGRHGFRWHHVMQAKRAEGEYMVV